MRRFQVEWGSCRWRAAWSAWDLCETNMKNNLKSTRAASNSPIQYGFKAFSKNNSSNPSWSKIPCPHSIRTNMCEVIMRTSRSAAYRNDKAATNDEMVLHLSCRRARRIRWRVKWVCCHPTPNLFSSVTWVENKFSRLSPNGISDFALWGERGSGVKINPDQTIHVGCCREVDL